MTSPPDSSLDSLSHPADPWPDWLWQLAQSALPTFLMRQRWYPAKDAGTPQVALADRIALPFLDQSAAVTVWQVTPPGRKPLQLFVALALAREGSVKDNDVVAPIPPDKSPAGEAQVLVEGFALDGFVRAWMDLLLQPGGGRYRPARLMAQASAALSGRATQGTGEHLAIRRGSAEQSNTSIRIGDDMILKVYRRLEPGINPELEVGRFLTGEAKFSATPSMLGWFNLDAAGGEGQQTLAILQAFVSNDGDGWDWLLKRLARGAGGDTAALGESLAWLKRLGTRTAGMHHAFAIDCTDPAFQPEPVGAADLRAWSDDAKAMAARALDGLAGGRDRLPTAAATAADSLLSRRDRLQATVGSLLQDGLMSGDQFNKGADFHKTRHHGDYHLGQVLVTDNDAIIVDFEGEPMRPLAERRGKHAALRDVAGLMRSLAYAAAAARRALPADLTAEAHTASESRLSSWEAVAARSYLDAYLAATQGMRGCPTNRAAAEGVIQFFMLDKALYEINYELANRPDWVAIPLQGVLDLLDDQGDGNGGGDGGHDDRN
ncbi:MAG: putative maltokinase [Lautropia sp.]